MPPVLVQRLSTFPTTNDLPRFATAGAAAMDLQSAEDFPLPPGKTAAIHTGLAFAVPEGYEMQVRSRSGLAAKHAVFVTNGIGTIDSDYRGEVMVVLSNFGSEVLHIKVGDRIAQLAFSEVYGPAVTAVEELPATLRGSGGFGSTGR
jgi:dUTP pyrophosphatase